MPQYKSVSATLTLTAGHCLPLPPLRSAARSARWVRATTLSTDWQRRLACSVTCGRTKSSYGYWGALISSLYSSPPIIRALL
ncbi:hypothetical protein IEO21_04633 [Rhodonia placenta]|uniref:Uncharacterized protein n=1 Tax=Rhodonia placenta TaxID=104341 RepID=A0A8H7U308_9APHY|nr:hypothetical protein IEO21_04633 [Postia placenta]